MFTAISAEAMQKPAENNSFDRMPQWADRVPKYILVTPKKLLRAGLKKYFSANNAYRGDNNYMARDLLKHLSIHI